MKRTLLLLIFAALAVGVAFAQDQPVAVLEYVEDEFELQILDSNDFEVNFYLGMGLSPGDQVITEDTSVEIRLQPNGSVVRVAPDTDFTVEALQGRDSAEESRFGVARGRMRMVAARLTGTDNQYSVRTPTAVAGVRGTDFGVTVGAGVDGSEPIEELFVFEGEVLFNAIETGESIFVGAGQRANVFAETFIPQQMTPAEIQERRSGLDFQALDPSTVPGNEPEEPVEDEAEAETQEETGEDTEEAAEEDEESLSDQAIGKLAEILGLQVGSTTINGVTYGQVIAQPEFELGKIRLGLYLPITYNENVFDPDDWYRPDGNDEWSFGTDQDWENEPLEAARDAANDVLLKIRYLEFADRGEPFFFKVGNLDNLTVGNGLLMYNYNNNVDFPAVRRLGFNLGIDGERAGFEAVVNDVGEPEIFGGRVYLRPLGRGFPLTFGLTGLADIAPASEIADDLTAPAGETELENLVAAREADPVFINVGADVGLPIVRSDIMSILLFGEGGGMVPFVKNTIPDTDIQGFQFDQVYDKDTQEFSNYGWAAGVRGNVLFLDYRLEFRDFQGSFRGRFFDTSYDRFRATYAANLVARLKDPANADGGERTLGVFGEAGGDVLGLLQLNAGYFWPFEETADGAYEPSPNDELVVSVDVSERLIPFGITAGLEYRRTQFAPTIFGWDGYAELKPFDANTTLNGYLSYPVSDLMRLVGTVSTTVVRDDAGNIEYDANGQPNYAPVVTIQTEIGF